MDHSHMGHGGMDHGNMGHGGGDMADMCNMNMLFTWDTTNLCILWKQWHIRGPVSLVFSLLAIVLFCVGYEYAKIATYQRDADAKRSTETVPTGEPVTESTPLAPRTTGHRQVKIEQRSHAVQTVRYAVTTFWGLIIMLLFMTFNGFVMLAVVFGTGLGYYLFGKSKPAARESLCH